HNQEVMIPDEVDDAVGKHADLAASDDRETIPARKLGPSVGTPLDVINRLGDLDVELVAETGLGYRIGADGIQELGLRLRMDAVTEGHLRRSSKSARAFSRVCSKVLNSTRLCRMSSDRKSTRLNSSHVKISYA